MATIRRAVPADGEGIGEAHAESWRVGYEGLFPSDVLAAAAERRRRLWTQRGADVGPADVTLLVAEDPGRISGFNHFGPASADRRIGEVYGFYVHPDFWGEGTAQALMGGAVASLGTTFASAVLWANAGARRARRFYAKSGWTETGAERTETLWDGLEYPAVEYGRTLDPP
jgi:GNAT superfamily N-acetyltransferase